MEQDSKIPLLVKAIAVFLIFIGVVGTFTGAYLLNTVNNSPADTYSTRDASRSILDASLILARDKNNIRASFEQTEKATTDASVGILEASAELKGTGDSLSGTSNKIKSAGEAMAASARSDKATAASLRESADAMDLLWGPTNVALKVRAAAENIETSAEETTKSSDDMIQASSDTAQAALKVREAAIDLDGVSGDLIQTADGMGKAASSIDSLAQQMIINMNEIVGALEWLDAFDKKTLLYEVILYFMVIHIIFAGTGIAILLLTTNLYG